MPVELADLIVKEHWTDSKRNIRDLKGKVMAECHKLIDQHDVDWGDIRTGRGEKAYNARQHMCAFVYLVLFDRMSEVEMSEWLGIKRTTFRYSRVAFFEKNSEPIPT
tara:strand:- start:54 stop:374 length:321 start_codon:yes stop_codon:yes gene_type:complete